MILVNIKRERMSELSYVLLNSKADKFDCGNVTINEYIEWSYFVTLSQQCYAYKILYKSLIVGYYMITLRDVALTDCPGDESDYSVGEFGDHVPSLYINYIAIDKRFQKKGIGTKTLEKIIIETRQLVDRLPIRFITINAVPEKVDWYKKIGFKEMGSNIDGVNRYMFIDIIRDKQKLVDYCEEQHSALI